MDDNQDNNASSRSTVHWGAKNIGPVINQTERQTIHLLQTGQIKCAQKKGGRWCAGDAALSAEFGIGGQS